MSAILDGIRIVDWSEYIAGPVATRLLAEAGADVVKVESPIGDRARWLNPTGFAAWNRSKRNVVLDFDCKEGKVELEALLKDADVFVHEFTPQRAEELDVDDDSLAARHPSLIVASITGMPFDHPDVELLSNDDFIVQAQVGMLSEVPGLREGPTFVSLPLPSWHAVYLLAAGIVARLELRTRTGRSGAVH